MERISSMGKERMAEEVLADGGGSERGAAEYGVGRALRGGLRRTVTVLGHGCGLLLISIFG